MDYKNLLFENGEDYVSVGSAGGVRLVAPDPPPHLTHAAAQLRVRVCKVGDPFYVPVF